MTNPPAGTPTTTGAATGFAYTCLKCGASVVNSAHSCPAGTPNAVEEARREVETGNLHPMRHDIFCAKVDALIAAVRAEEREKHQEWKMAKTHEVADLMAQVRSVRTQAFADVRRVVEDVEVDCSTCHCATPYSSEDPVAYCNRCVALREFRHALYAALDALSLEGK